MDYKEFVIKALTTDMLDFANTRNGRVTIYKNISDDLRKDPDIAKIAIVRGYDKLTVQDTNK